MEIPILVDIFAGSWHIYWWHPHLCWFLQSVLKVESLYFCFLILVGPIMLLGLDSNNRKRVLPKLITIHMIRKHVSILSWEPLYTQNRFVLDPSSRHQCALWTGWFSVSWTEGEGFPLQIFVDWNGFRLLLANLSMFLGILKLSHDCRCHFPFLLFVWIYVYIYTHRNALLFLCCWTPHFRGIPSNHLPHFNTPWSVYMDIYSIYIIYNIYIIYIYVYT